MRKRSIRNMAAAAVILLLVCAASSAAFAQKATVLRVVVVKTDDPAAYAQEIEKGRQVMKSLGVQGQTRVWQAQVRRSGSGHGGRHASSIPTWPPLPTPSPRPTPAANTRPGSRASTKSERLSPTASTPNGSQVVPRNLKPRCPTLLRAFLRRGWDFPTPALAGALFFRIQVE